jgi:subtilisin family serine protease
LKEYPVYLSFFFLIGQVMHMKRVRKNRTQGRLCVERLEARRYLAADVGNSLLDSGVEYIPNELLVQYATQSMTVKRGPAFVGIDAEVSETIHTKAMQASGLGVLERLTLGSGISMQSAMEAIKRNPNVLYVEPNYIYRPSVVSNDTYYTNGSLWGMYSNDSPAAVGPSGTTNQFGSQAEKAWNDNITGSSNVIIGVVDEGIQATHPDLVDNMWVNPFEVAGDGIDNDGNGYVDDIRGWDFVANDNSVYDGTSDDHGTHVAGTIGATGGNGTGVVGVNWDVTMISLKFLGATGGSTANAIKALDYVTDLKNRHGLNIVATSNSWGGGGYSQALHDAIIRSANKNILFVAAAGNGGSDGIGDSNDTVANYPSNYNTTVGTSTQAAASYDSVIAVASITNTGAISGFSNFGATTVDIGAPGSGVWSTVPSNTYASYNGTSMATPHVTGAVALYASTKPVGTSAASIKQAILQSATPTASLAGKTVTGGRLNVYEAVRSQYAINVSAPTPAATTTEAGGAVSFSVTLGSAPTANVTIPLTSSDTTEGTISTASIVFTPTNWNTPQTVTVTGVDDSIDDGNVAYIVLLGAATSSDTNYNGLNPSDVSLTNTDNDTAGITVSAPSGTTTTEAGGSVTFTIRLNSEPTANVTIGISSSDTTEGTVSAASLVFTAGNWSVAQSVTVTGVDDTLVDGNIVYSVILAAAISTDSTYNGLNPADFSFTNNDNDLPPPTKFYVVDDATTNRTFEYDAAGGAVENYLLGSANTTPRGVATNAAGNRVWVVDNNRTVYVYNNSGGLLGSWVAGSLPTNAIVEGITTDGTNLWIVDNRGDRVYYYAGAASRISGTQNATSSFALNSSNLSPKDLVTDGTFIWVVNDSTSDRVFRYNLAGVLQNSWAINSANSLPTGITLDPSNGSQDLWIVDSGTDRVYRYANARTLTAPTLTSFFALAAGNTNPQGIADPPASDATGYFEIFVDGPMEPVIGQVVESIFPIAMEWRVKSAETSGSEFVQQPWSTSNGSSERFSVIASRLRHVGPEPAYRADLLFASTEGPRRETSQSRITKPTANALRDQVFVDLGLGLP